MTFEPAWKNDMWSMYIHLHNVQINENIDSYLAVSQHPRNLKNIPKMSSTTSSLVNWCLSIPIARQTLGRSKTNSSNYEDKAEKPKFCDLRCGCATLRIDPSGQDEWSSPWGHWPGTPGVLTPPKAPSVPKAFGSAGRSWQRIMSCRTSGYGCGSSS